LAFTASGAICRAILSRRVRGELRRAFSKLTGGIVREVQIRPCYHLSGLRLEESDTRSPSAGIAVIGPSKLCLKQYGSHLMSARHTNDVAISDVIDVASANAIERLITVSELADRLRYSPGWVRAQVKAGGIPCIKFNSRAWRFHWPTVLAALKNL
jgi:hypothetical protein